ncbi:protein CMSS1 [Engraulis encrasicolus]|uniref:protein CMSS1 n=1 Tax=Engraulis encrasicolus TaxID=184585 RepID=UPI002FD542CA
MGDDLGDEWWVHGEDSGVSEGEAAGAEEVTKEKKTKKKGKPQGKRKSVEEEDGDEEQIPKKKKKRKIDDTETPAKDKKKKNLNQKEKGGKPTKDVQTGVVKKKNSIPKTASVAEVVKDEVQPEGEKKKKKRKKKRITEVLAVSEPCAATPADLQQALQTHLTNTRSVIEQEELTLHDSSFLTCNDLTHSLSSYMKQVCPKWAKLQKRHTMKSSLVIIIACSSALRVLELIKQLAVFKGEAKILKLFARHIKVEEQVQLLKKFVSHIGVGTPARIAELIQKDGLSLEALKYVVLDWNWRDQKCRRMVDVPEVKPEMFKMLETGILQRCRSGDTKIGLF